MKPNASEKLYVDARDKVDEDIEYIRKDAFIDKVWSWIEDNMLSSNQQDKLRFYYEQFINCMEGKVMNINNPSMQDLKDGWISIKDRPLKLGEEVIGYNPSWIDEDFNPNGTRIGFLSDYGDNEVEGQINIENPDGGYQHFCQAKWCDYHDTYVTLYGEVGEDEPNMPTHYLLIPKHP